MNLWFQKIYIYKSAMKYLKKPIQKLNQTLKIQRMVSTQ